MSNSRQLDEGVLARSYGLTFAQRALWPPASESWDQLVYAIRGAVTVRTQTGTWVVPPHRAVWLPAETVYGLQMAGETALRMIYLPKSRPTNSEGTFDRTQCAVVSVSPLLRELILRTVQIGALDARFDNHRRLAGLIEDEVQAIGTVPLQLPAPTSQLALSFAEAIETGLGSPISIPRILRECGASRRSMERLFRSETGMSLGQWIRRRKLLDGLEHLVAGESATSVAFRLGYNGPSAFIAMFRRELGATPGEYVGQPYGNRPDQPGR